MMLAGWRGRRGFMFDAKYKEFCAAKILMYSNRRKSRLFGSDRAIR
jgi:hypothetical protein